MIYSMTGFGRGEGVVIGVNVVVEIRSLNNRFLEIAIRLPRKLSSYEDPLRDLLQKEFSRGKIDVQVMVNEEKKSLTRLCLNESMLQRYIEILDTLKTKLQINDTINVTQLLNLPDLLIIEEYPRDHEKFLEGLQKVTQLSIKNLRISQEKEGKALINDMKQRVKNIQKQLSEIQQVLPNRRKEAFNNLKTKVKQLINNDTIINKERLELEIALLAEKSDITEECVRLKSHIDLYLSAVKEGGTIGKRLDFILQEMNREVNTIGAKGNNFEISHLVVEMKDEIERLKEQVRNLA